MGQAAAVRTPSAGGVTGTRGVDLGVPALLLSIAVVAWWWSIRMADDMSGMDPMGMAGTMSFGAFVLAWAAMMAAMMFPAVSPVVKLYARASTQGRVAPLPFFVVGYLVLWTVIGVPAYFGWRALDMPLAEGHAWVGRLAGSAFVLAAAWQLTPLKSVCLRHCRSPMGFFMRFGTGAGRALGAAKMGMAHGLFCIGCCWALFVVLVAVGTMNLLWMVLLTGIIILEKNGPQGERVALAGAAGFALLGLVLLVNPSTLVHVT